jgi:TctA family transporter
MASDGNLAFHQRRRDSDHEGFLAHRRMRWLKVALAISLAAILGYALADVEPRPNGGTWYGYTLGTIGAGLIVWLSLLGVRKRAITAGRWSLKAWTSAHVYLGLALIVIATLHTGFQFSWNVHTLAYGLMMLVIASGIYGVVVYATLPQALSDNRHAMTKSQMIDALAAVDRQLEAAAQPLARDEADLVIAALAQDTFAAGVVARLSGRYRDCRTDRALQAFGEHADERVAALLRKRQAQLAQIRRHLRLRALLEVWLYVHVPLTVMLLAALTAHIISVFYYW